MDHAKFLERLSEVAQWKKDQDLDSAEIQGDHSLHTCEPIIESVKPVVKPCEDCGLVVDRRVHYYFQTRPRLHYREKCMNCKMYKNPFTGQFTEDPHQHGLNKIFVKYLDKKQKK